MLTLRRYKESDARQVGILIADTYNTYNLSELSTRQQEEMLGPFWYVRSSEPAHQKAIAEAIRAKTVLVAEMDGRIVGVLRGGRVDEKGRTVLQSLFVSGNCHRQGIGRKLVERFEKEYVAHGVMVFKLWATIYAVPFYQAMGYRKSTGVRLIHSFEGQGLPSQPMKKVVKKKENK
jgi:N-acetylglutamate synthase-like GNAT family acetyltransferase